MARHLPLGRAGSVKGEGLPKSHGGESQERNGGVEGSERSQTAGDGQQRQAQTEFREG